MLNFSQWTVQYLGRTHSELSRAVLLLHKTLGLVPLGTNYNEFI